MDSRAWLGLCVAHINGDPYQRLPISTEAHIIESHINEAHHIGGLYYQRRAISTDAHINGCPYQRMPISTDAHVTESHIRTGPWISTDAHIHAPVHAGSEWPDCGFEAPQGPAWRRHAGVPHVEVHHRLLVGRTRVVDGTLVELEGPLAVEESRLLWLRPARHVYDGQCGAGVARRRVRQLSHCLLPRTAPQVEAVDEHSLGRRVADLKPTAASDTVACGGVDSMILWASPLQKPSTSGWIIRNVTLINI